MNAVASAEGIINGGGLPKITLEGDETQTAKLVAKVRAVLGGNEPEKTELKDGESVGIALIQDGVVAEVISPKGGTPYINAPINKKALHLINLVGLIATRSIPFSEIPAKLGKNISIRYTIYKR